MTSITPLFENVYRKADFLALLTEAVNGGFVSLSYALSITEGVASKPGSRLILSKELTTLAGLRDAASNGVARLIPSKKFLVLEPKIERALHRMENSHEL